MPSNGVNIPKKVSIVQKTVEQLTSCDIDCAVMEMVKIPQREGKGKKGRRLERLTEQKKGAWRKED